MVTRWGASGASLLGESGVERQGNGEANRKGGEVEVRTIQAETKL